MSKLLDRLTRHIKVVDYARNQPATIQFLPPDDLMPAWESDYRQMQENMIYGETVPFAALIERLTELQTRINTLSWN